MSADLFRRFRREDEAYKPMSDASLLDMARQLYASPQVRPLLDRVGLHGDLTGDEEALINALIIAEAERTIDAPQPENLTIPLALARRFAAGLADPADTPAGLAFVADRRCDGLRNGPGPWRMAKVSELVQIMRNLDRREDLKAPFAAQRGRKLRKGECHFDDREDKGDLFYAMVQIALRREQVKYGLLNRQEAPFSSLSTLFDMYLFGEIDNFVNEGTIAWLLKGNDSPNDILHMIDDRAAP